MNLENGRKSQNFFGALNQPSGFKASTRVETIDGHSKVCVVNLKEYF